MRKKVVERGRVLVATRPIEGSGTSRAVFGLLTILTVLAAMFICRAALAADSPPPPPFTPGIVVFGVEAPAEGNYWFPDRSSFGGQGAGYWPVPDKSAKEAAEGFPLYFTMKCKVKLNRGAVTLECPADVVGKTLKGRVRGVLGVRTWSQSVNGVDGPVQHLGVTVYLESISVPGHTYTVSAEGAAKGHEHEVVLIADPTDVKEQEAILKFVHANVAPSTK